MSTQSAAPDDARLARDIRAMLAAAYKPTEPGAAVIVRRGGETVFRAAYGMANLELGVRMKPDMVFRIGSVTKQFTAVAVLMLVQEGKIGLQDEIMRFLPTYPVHGRRITIEHLLTHTSGIKSYTALPAYRSSKRTSQKPADIIDLFKNEPFDFEPGEKQVYSNSNYFLLGAIIEAAAGQAYADFVRERIFEVLGMRSTTYGYTAPIMPGRASGYQRYPSGFQNADYVSMTWPYAAGALVSSVDDLALWDDALYTDSLVDQKWLALAWTPARLSNGESTGYGFGWRISDYAGHRFVEHGGGIDGFLCYMLRLPEEKVMVAILQNFDSLDSPRESLSLKIAASLVGEPLRNPRPVRLSAAALDRHVGLYKSPSVPTLLRVSRDDGALYVQAEAPGAVPRKIVPTAKDRFFEPRSFNRYEFGTDESGTDYCEQTGIRGERLRGFRVTDSGSG